MGLTQGNVQVQAGKVHALVHEAVQHREVEGPSEVCQVVADLRKRVLSQLSLQSNQLNNDVIDVIQGVPSARGHGLP